MRISAGPAADEPAEGFLWLPLDLRGHARLPELPPGAVVAGHEYGRPTYVARVKRGDSWEVGKLNAWARFAVGYFGRELESDQGEVLITRDDCAPAWVNGGYGEHVPGVLMSQGPEGLQSVARAWHAGRWVPGKLVHACRSCFIPFGGRELAARKYQLLSTSFMWQALPADGSIPPGAVCTDDQPPRLAAPSNLLYAPSGQGSAVLTKLGSARGCEWVVSGDGEWVRHALAGPDGRPLARAWQDGGGSAGWAAGCVTAPGSCRQPAGVHLGGRCYRDYQVLTAGAPEPGPAMLTLHLQLDSAGHVVNSPSTPDKDVLLATALERGQSPWVAVVQMVSTAEAVLREKAAAEAAAAEEAALAALAAEMQPQPQPEPELVHQPEPEPEPEQELVLERSPPMPQPQPQPQLVDSREASPEQQPCEEAADAAVQELLRLMVLPQPRAPVPVSAPPQQPGSSEAGSEASFAVVQPPHEPEQPAAAVEAVPVPAPAASEGGSARSGQSAAAQWEELEVGDASERAPASQAAAEPGYLSDHTSDEWDFLDGSSAHA